MTFDEFEKAKIVIDDIKKIDEKITLLDNKYENFLATSYKGQNIIVRKSMIIDKDMQRAIVNHLLEKKKDKLKELKAI